ncbi:PfkB family carbohydrate kinase [Erysipelothrix rhusiopathiae]|nr:PfkB family carbohydrate kinase [Erysipelothrix rhusiopathiae]
MDSVGAGDSMVAAFIYGYVNDYSLVDASWMFRVSKTINK